MKPRLQSGVSSISRGYATRITPRKRQLPRNPPARIEDPLSTSTNAVTTSLSDDLTFIHRPPPSAPSPYSYTTLPASPLLRPSSGHSDKGVPPSVKEYVPKKNAPPRLSDEDLKELKRLRYSDPLTWSRKKLAVKFNCSQQFVSMVAALQGAALKETKQRRDKEHEEARSKWGVRTKMVREMRQKRKEFW